MHVYASTLCSIMDNIVRIFIPISVNAIMCYYLIAMHCLVLRSNVIVLFICICFQDGCTAVMLSAEYGHEELVELLCESYEADLLYRKKVSYCRLC